MREQSRRKIGDSPHQYFVCEESVTIRYAALYNVAMLHLLWHQGWLLPLTSSQSYQEDEFYAGQVFHLFPPLWPEHFNTSTCPSFLLSLTLVMNYLVPRTPLRPASHLQCRAPVSWGKLHSSKIIKEFKIQSYKFLTLFLPFKNCFGGCRAT